MKLALVNVKGLSNSTETRHLAPNGALSITAYVKAILPDISVEVHDENQGSLDFEAIAKNDYIGFSTFSFNDSQTKKMAELIKGINPNGIVVLGGPNTQDLGPQILKNKPYIDYIIIGEGEKPIVQLLQGKPLDSIPGLVYRDGQSIISNKPEYNLELNDIPPISPSHLSKKYVWDKFDPFLTIHNFFPISKNRGCFRTHRCAMCAINTVAKGVPGKEYWAEIQQLYERYGIDHFFDTADSFPTQKLDEYLDSKPDGLNVFFRSYLFPELMTEKVAKKMKQMGFLNAFIGPESWRYFADAGQQRMIPFKFSEYFSVKKLIEGIKTFGKYGIEVTPSFVLGEPGETEESLTQTMKMIREVAFIENVREIELNRIKVMPGNEYFRQSKADTKIVERYEQETGDNLLTTDEIDYGLLSTIFINNRTQVGKERILEAQKELYRELAYHSSIFSYDNLKGD